MADPAIRTKHKGSDVSHILAGQGDVRGTDDGRQAKPFKGVPYERQVHDVHQLLRIQTRRSNLLAIMNVPAVIRNAHGNWKTTSSAAAGSGMADVYTESTEIVSAKAKTLVARTIQLAIQRLNRIDFS